MLLHLEDVPDSTLQQCVALINRLAGEGHDKRGKAWLAAMCPFSSSLSSYLHPKCALVRPTCLLLHLQCASPLQVPPGPLQSVL